MKMFKVKYERHEPNCLNKYEWIVPANSSEEAIERFWNHRMFPESMTERQIMEYEQKNKGILWSELIVSEINEPFDVYKIS